LAADRGHTCFTNISCSYFAFFQEKKIEEVRKNKSALKTDDGDDISPDQ
jgi:hypothetical protein